MTVETGDAVPRKQAACRVPFAVRLEVATQLQTILEQSIIQPSSSLWASPIVLVRKKMVAYGSVLTIEVLTLLPSQTIIPCQELMTCWMN